MMFPNYILEFRNTKVYLGWWVKIQIVIENHVCSIVVHCYHSSQAISWYILFNAR